MTFIQNILHIVINRYEAIQVTAGTYSLPTKIEPSDFSFFITNLKISFSSNVFQFVPVPTFIYYGDIYGSFCVGADQSIIPTLYPYDIVKK